MIYIYNDYGGTHTTSLAAAYHLDRLPTNRKLTKSEILNVNYFNKLTSSDFGKLIYHGTDEEGNPVYTIGRKRQKLVVAAMKDLSLVLQSQFKNNEKIILSNTSPTVPLPLTFGGLFSRGLKIDFIGVPLCVWGAKICCEDVLRLVENTKRVGKSASEKVVVLDNKEFK